MAKNAKFKSGKFAKMTEEQKLIYLEQQRLAEEEAQRNKQELVSQYLKMKLEKEEMMSRVNQDKLGVEWRQILRQIKSTEMKKEILILSQVFERMMDMKESSLGGLCKDLEEAEEQFMMAKRSHLHNIDHLINFQRQRISKMGDEFNEQRSYLKNNFDDEKETLVVQHEREVIKMENIIYAMEETIMEKESEVKAEFQANMDEIKNKNLEDVHTLRLKHDLMLENLLQLFKESLRSYQEATEERKKSFEQLKLKDDTNTSQIHVQKKKIGELEARISKCKLQMANNVKQWAGKNEEACYEKTLVTSELLVMKKKFQKIMKEEKDGLARLLLIIKEVQDSMKVTIKQGEKLLRAAERCRKLESEREKVVPVYEDWWGEEDRKVYQRMLAEEPREPLTKMMDDYSELENFWRRYNKVALEKVALEAEVNDLTRKKHSLLKMVKGRVVDLVGRSDLPSSLFTVKANTNVS